MKILLAGTARCGSTWAANVLGRAAQTRSVYEPDGPDSDVLGATLRTRLGDYPVLTVDQRNFWYRVVWDLAFAGGWPWDRVETARAAGRRLVKVPPALRDYMVVGLAEGTRIVRPRPRNIIVKSVNSAFSLDWIYERYTPKVVILRRNPLNIVSSWLVLNMWSTKPIGGDPLVQRAYVTPRGLTPPNGGSSNVAVAAWNVGLLVSALREGAARHPEWVVASHDELSNDPLTGFQDLAKRLGLRWTQEMSTYLHKSDDPQFTVHGGSARVHPNAVTATTGGTRREQQATQYRRRLSPEQAAEARAILERFDLGEWGPPQD
jgi:hypothetical protein